jgi:hypothetical protein
LPGGSAIPLALAEQRPRKKPNPSRRRKRKTKKDGQLFGRLSGNEDRCLGGSTLEGQLGHA